MKGRYGQKRIESCEKKRKNGCSEMDQKKKRREKSKKMKDENSTSKTENRRGRKEKETRKWRERNCKSARA
jgi:hypothetical protein